MKRANIKKRKISTKTPKAERILTFALYNFYKQVLIIYLYPDSYKKGILQQSLI